MKRINSVDAAEDLVQETLLAAMVAQDSFSGRSELRTWLVGILKHKIVDHLRRTKGHAVGVDAAAAEQSEEQLRLWADDQFTARGKWKEYPAQWRERGLRDDPSAESERSELGKALSDCMEKLPPQVAEVLLLNERASGAGGGRRGGADGSSAEHLSKILGLSTTNIGVILYRARLALRRCLEVNWFGRKRDRDT